MPESALREGEEHRGAGGPACWVGARGTGRRGLSHPRVQVRVAQRTTATSVCAGPLDFLRLCPQACCALSLPSMGSQFPLRSVPAP